MQDKILKYKIIDYNEDRKLFMKLDKVRQEF